MTTTEHRKSIFVVRFSDDGEFLPYGWLCKNAVDACYHVRLHNKERAVEVTEFEIIGQGTIRKGLWAGDVFLALWHRDLERREAEARAEKRKVE